jgi:hypothetical protein
MPEGTVFMYHAKDRHLMTQKSEVSGGHVLGVLIPARWTRALGIPPLIYQLHVTAAWMIWGLWPFSRLVHAWSYPLWYLWRPYIVYRSRRPAPPAEPGTGGRKWRKIGAPY